MKPKSEPISVVKDSQLGQSDPFSPEAKKSQLITSRGTELISKLDGCPKGFAGWRQYEDICAEILKYCLDECFEAFNLEQQATTWDRHQRMDILVKNRPRTNPTSNYWASLQSKYTTHTIVFECKNYSDAKPIGNSEVLQAKDYEIPEHGLFRVILTRQLPSSQAINAIRHWHLYPPHWMIIVLTDDDIKAMITARMNNESVESIFYSAEDNERAGWYR